MRLKASISAQPEAQDFPKLYYSFAMNEIKKPNTVPKQAPCLALSDAILFLGLKAQEAGLHIFAGILSK